MRVCDITRNDEVVKTYTLIAHGDDESDERTVFTLELGKQAADALEGQAWGTLQTLTPPALRVKDAAKAAAAKKAGATRKANRAAKAGQTTLPAPVGESGTAVGTNSADDQPQTNTEPPSDQSEPLGDGPGF